MQGNGQKLEEKVYSLEEENQRLQVSHVSVVLFFNIKIDVFKAAKTLIVLAGH